MPELLERPFMEISEFIDTYSDDLICLHEARRALLTHPLNAHYASSDLLDASFCRVTAVFAVGAIDAMLAEWRDAQRDRVGILDQWFGQKARNGERVRNLYQAFRDAGILVDEEVFNDYLAIKYLRNTIVHGRWHEHEKEWVDQRGFPTDARQLSTEHLHKFDHVIQNMMLYISLTAIAGGRSSEAAISPANRKLVRLDENATRRVDDRGILKIQDLDRIIWNNVEKISSVLWHAIEKAASADRYEWSGGRKLEEIEAPAHEDRKRLLFLAARRAGEDNYEPLAQHRELAREALAFWREYWGRARSGRRMQEQEVGSALQELLQPTNGKVTERALQLGRCAYDAIPNVMPVTLLTLYLPIVDPENTAKYLEESDRVRPVFRLARAWYGRVERGVASSDEGLGFYDQMANEFRRCSSDPREESE
jgi:hypothetical protein